MSAYVWSDARVREALGLSVARSRDDVEYTSVSTDTRTVTEGALFVALVGDNFDGHDFAAEAVSLGARGLVISRPVAGEGVTPTYPVQDTLVALGALARRRREDLSAQVVGITGSSGKTTTKEFVAAVLSSRLRVHATKGNLNNRIGMPMTLLAAPSDAEVVVLEMGTNEPGEIGALAGIATPDVGVLTTVGASHLEKLGSVEGVLDEKLDLLRGLREGGVCLVGDEPAMLVEGAREVCSDVRVAGWGDDADPDLRPGSPTQRPGGAWTFTWEGHTIDLGLPGRHAVTDALLALSVASTLGVDPEAAAQALSGVVPTKLRGEVREIGALRVTVDCYNANPQSVRGALDVLEAQEGRRRIAVLGSMLELGTESARLHGEVLRAALDSDVELVVATGLFAEPAAGAASERLVAAQDWQSAYPELRDRLAGDEAILLKASRGVAMEGLLSLLEADFGTDAEPTGNRR